MKTLALLFSLFLIPFSDVFAAYQSFPVRNRLFVTTVNSLGEIQSTHHRTRYDSALFRVEVVGDLEGIKSESSKNGKPFVGALREERFAVRLYNPLPVRVAVNLTVDGLNSITGKPSGISDGDKWIIDPYSFITVRGWQVSEGQARRFFFTDKPKSYAKWMGDYAKKDLSANCGVIGAAYFWSQHELDRYHQDHPQIQYVPMPYNAEISRLESMKSSGMRAGNLSDAEFSRKPAAAQAIEEKAGTGMGERESNPTTLVNFSYDTGMYDLAQAVVIYYDFATVTPSPNPFPAISFAPEMP